MEKCGKNKNVKIISDGELNFQDLIKAIAVGADAIMMGSIFAGTEESAVKNLKLKTNYIKFIEEWGYWSNVIWPRKDTSKKT